MLRTRAPIPQVPSVLPESDLNFEKIFVPDSTFKKIDNGQISITPREKEVMHLLAHGMSSKKIAGEMHISFHTVESYRKKLLNKFKVRTTIEMILLAGSVLPKEFWMKQGQARETISRYD
ncbi:MAG TPA: helix-turn-helix transcriptional regulator [Chryseosolibacter sp.]